jgi:hypothetical protein
MKKTLLNLSADTTKYTLNKLDYNCLYNNTPCKVIVKVASILFVWLILFISYNDFVQYKGEQIGQTILPDINGNAVADPGIFFLSWSRLKFVISSRFATAVYVHVYHRRYHC